MTNKLTKRLLAFIIALAVVSSGIIAVASDETQFTDMDNHWSATSVNFCLENGIMNGTASDTFEPDAPARDVMVKLVLERILKKTENAYDSYVWTSSVTRQETAELIVSALGETNYSGDISTYTDAGEVSDDCKAGVAWCVANGIMLGDGNNVFAPNAVLSRGELAAVAQRLYIFVTQTGSETDKKTINIIHTNDMHGYNVQSSSAIGIDRIAALKAQTPNSVLVDAGDATQGVSFASLSNGHTSIQAMNLAGYDVMAAGNHEFDYGQDNIKELAAMAEFPIISANTIKNGKPFFMGTYSGGKKENNGENTIITVDGVKIGFFGITTTETATATMPTGIVGITFEDEVKTAKEQVAKLKAEGADVIIGLFHVGVSQAAGVTTPQIADELSGTGISAIIDGHSHSVYNSTENGILIAQTGSYSANVGILSFDYKDGVASSFNEKLLSEKDTENITPDSNVSEYVNSVVEEQGTQLNVLVAKTENTLWGGYINNVAEPRLSETNLGDLICDAMLSETKNLLGDENKANPTVAVENGGGIRASCKNGDITFGNINDVLPFGNTIVIKEVSPSVLYQIMEVSVLEISGQDAQTGMLSGNLSGGFLQIGGMKMEYYPKNAAGEKVSAIYLDGSTTPLDKNDTTTRINFATNDFLAAGGNGYEMLATVKTTAEGEGLATILERYIKSIAGGETGTMSYPITQNRIVAKSDYAGQDYTAKLYVKNTSGELLKNQNFTVYVDCKEVSGTTDVNGVLSLTLACGPHAVKAEQNSEEVYVNNYSGVGLNETGGDYPVYYPTIAVAD